MKVIIRPMKRRSFSGFPLVELMIVVAIIGILAAIAIPKFGKLVSKSHESTTKGNLGAIRSALSVYYAENEGFYPADALAALSADSKYIVELPTVDLPATD